MPAGNTEDCLLPGDWNYNSTTIQITQPITITKSIFCSSSQFYNITVRGYGESKAVWPQAVVTYDGNGPAALLVSNQQTDTNILNLELT